MSEWLIFVKDYATKHNIPYKQALRDASPAYKKRNDVQPEVITPKEEKAKPKRNNNKKVVEKITLKL